MIELKDLSFAYPDGRVALAHVSLSIAEGERVAILGPNGAGKSTLLLHLNGILRGTGEIIIDGMKVSDDRLPEIRKRVGLIFQDPNDQLFCPTVFDDVAFGPMHFGIPYDRLDVVVRDALSQVKMEDAAERPAHHLSVGERRRVTIATVLACDPKILALDEPAAMLDARRRAWLTGFLNACGKTIVLATHDLPFARAMCHRAVLLNKGRIVADGAMEEIAADRDLLSANDL